tara:strand:- start:10 stop:186 length:177 start_codon:yes stop_codon:yes gene_type:complete
MFRCPFNIGKEQSMCDAFVLPEDITDEDSIDFYCGNTLIEDSKGYCEINHIPIIVNLN